MFRPVPRHLRATTLLVVGCLTPATLAAQDSARQPTGPTYASSRLPQYIPLESVRSGTVRMPASLARRVSVKLDAVPLQRVLMEIATQAGLGLSYGEDLVRAGTTVSVDIGGRMAADALAAAVAGTDWMVLVTASGQVTVSPARQATVGIVAGRVVDRASGGPLEAAQVTVDGTRIGASTSADGRFTLANVPSGPQRVTVRRIGYDASTQPVVVTDGATATLAFSLNRSAIALQQVVVTATGEQRTREIGNSLSTIDAADQRAPIVNTQDYLTARATGVTVLQNSGQPGTGGTIRLRGVNSVSQGNNPIIYVDGVRIFNGRTSTSVAGRQSVAPLNDIDPSDIERFEIVKGPAATTLYGTEASGGVIQIFTKRGKDGKAQWSAEATTGFNNMGHVGPASDPTGLFFNECRGPNTVIGNGTRFEDPTCPASGSWLGNGPIKRLSLGVRGGIANNLNYFVSGNFADERSVLPTGGNRDGGIRANLGFQPAPTLEMSMHSSYFKRTVDFYPDGNSSNGALLNISRGPGSNFKGPGCSDPTITCLSNDSLFISNAYTATDHFVTGGTATWRPTEKLENRLAVGFDYNDADIATITPFGHLRVPLGQYFETLWNRTLLTLDLASTYRQPLGSHFGSTTAIGGQMFDSRLHSTDLQSDNFAGPGEPTLISGSLRTINDVTQQRVINAGFFLQEMVSWRDRLFVTGGLRVDGNSAFGKDFGLQKYPKVSVAYSISDESFWPARLVESMKLRGALGESGKAPGAFDAVRTYDPVAAENGQPAFTPSQVGNPLLGPERTREVEAGFDAGMFGGRIGVNYTYYKQRTSGALIPVVLPPSQGFTAAQLTNVGELNNHGQELTVNAAIVQRRAFDLSGRLQLTTFNSRAGYVGGSSITIDALSRSYVREGYPVPSYFGYRVTNPDEFAAPVVDSNAYLGATFPTKIISPSLSLKLYERLTIDALGEWQLGGHLLNAIAYQNSNLASWQPCYYAQDKQRQFAAGNPAALDDVNALTRNQCSQSAAVRDYAYWVESSDFFKLRSVALTYDVPANLLRGLRNATVVLAGRNLFTDSRYSGTDPEVADQRDNSFSRRDYYVFPTYRSFTATIRTSF